MGYCLIREKSTYLKLLLLYIGSACNYGKHTDDLETAKEFYLAY